MCGRYVLMSNPELLVELFKLAGLPQLDPRYNIAPTQPAAVVRRRRGEAGGNQLDLLHWGLIPFWAKDPGVGARMINARAETAPEKPAFREALRRRRCLVPADGFYEWRTTRDGKVPYLIRRRDGRPFAMAGLWERWRERLPESATPDAEPTVIDSFTILTTTPNPLVARLHDRMPVILDPAHFDAWLDRELQDTDQITPLMKPLAAETLTAHPVGRRVNRPEHDDAACVEPALGPRLEDEPETTEPAAGTETGLLFE